MDIYHNRTQKVEPVHINSKYLEPARYWLINRSCCGKIPSKKQYFFEDYFRITETSYIILKQIEAPLWKKNRLYKIPKADS